MSRREEEEDEGDKRLDRRGSTRMRPLISFTSHRSMSLHVGQMRVSASIVSPSLSCRVKRVIGRSSLPMPLHSFFLIHIQQQGNKAYRLAWMKPGEARTRNSHQRWVMSRRSDGEKVEIGNQWELRDTGHGTVISLCNIVEDGEMR